jgi:hypothetical protein
VFVRKSTAVGLCRYVIQTRDVEPEPEPEAPSVSIIDDVLKLKHSYESKREAAITEPLMKQNQIRKQLEELGYEPEPEFLKPATKKAPQGNQPGRNRTLKRFVPSVRSTMNIPFLGTTAENIARKGTRRSPSRRRN